MLQPRRARTPGRPRPASAATSASPVRWHRSIAILAVGLLLAVLTVPAVSAQPNRTPNTARPQATPATAVRKPATPATAVRNPGTPVTARKPGTPVTRPTNPPRVTIPAKPGITIPATRVPGTLTPAQLTGERSRTQRPDMAVAMGDSYVSGEGAEDFIVGDGFNDYLTTFPGYRYRNPAAGSPATNGPSNQNHDYFCHRSRNSSIFAADIPGIERKRQLACSGGSPYDVVFNSLTRDGRAAQIEMLRTAAQRNDVDVIMIGLGANTARATFGSILGKCHLAFMIDAADSIGEAQISLLAASGIIGDDKLDMTEVQQIANRHGCRNSDMPTAAEWDETSEDISTAVSAVIDAMAEEGYAPGEYRIVMQNYTNPFATTLPAALRSETSGGPFGTQKTDTDGSFKGLARERYANGCPLHERSLTTAVTVTNSLHTAVVRAANRVRSAHPGSDILMMDVRQAFAGGLLCEDNSGPVGKFSNPVWFRNGAHQIQRTWPRNDNLNFIPTYLGLAQPCGKHWGLCQESGHPNEAGHAVLGDCLAGAATYSGNARMVRCSGNNGNVNVIGVGAGA